MGDYGWSSHQAIPDSPWELEAWTPGVSFSVPSPSIF